jgi:hypothetical protein
LAGALKKEVVASLPYRDVPLAHFDAHHVIINERQDTSLVVAKERHDETVETIQGEQWCYGTVTERFDKEEKEEDADSVVESLHQKTS